MSAADLGQKRRCNACGMKFYDFKKSPITCPSCNAEFDPDSLLKSRRGRASAKQEEKAPSKADDSNDQLLEDNSDEFDNDDNFEDDDTLPSDDDGLIAVKGDDDDEMEEGTAEFIDVLDSEEDDQDGDTEDGDDDEDDS